MADMVKRYAKTPVGAHYGVGDWLLQRLTAVVMAIYTMVVFIGVLLVPPHTYAEWKSFFSPALFRVATMLFVAALLYHAWVGMRDILMDYLKATAVRLTAQAAVGLVLLFYLVWTASILWGISK
jgi:succinate dehydrogenase / fumarate reductase membrane anchor subunit